MHLTFLQSIIWVIIACFLYAVACKKSFSMPADATLTGAEAVTGETYFQFKKECTNKLRDCETEYDYNQL